MIVTPIQGRKGDPIATHDGILFLFDRRAPQPAIGTPVEVMISHAPPRRFAPDYALMSKEDRQRNPPTIPFLIVRPVTGDDCLVRHRGFECSGSMCQTTASVEDRSRDEVHRRLGTPLGWLTPGRSPVIVAENVNRGSAWQQPLQPRTPGLAYVTAADVRQGLQRICGVPDLDQIDPETLAEVVRQRPRRSAASSEPRRTVDTLTSRRGQRSA
ncbi:hypothetical protein [Methylobacterium aquaticum]|uniref:Uncharacterized protein n=1 Tax=Methylobacterium aquaticum TaxID=270351 RepID=A0A0C6FXQ6_9HYPH|nr:hypothetical protein [Methylobacterium aquaticum]BAQ50369.1 hypothetical protein Maq22A_4p60055 [Methylobacterium aquaticum]